MSDLSGNKFVLSHDHSGYDFTGKIDKLIVEESTREWVKSYISMLLSYASDPKYISGVTRTKSHFVKDGYVIMIESYAQQDNRHFIESEVTIEKADKEIPFDKYYPYSMADFSFNSSTEFFNAIFFFLFNTFISETTTMFCLVNDAMTTRRIQGVLSQLDDIFLKNNSCIEVIKEIPPIKASVAICHCIQPQDKDNYFNSISKKYENFIFADFTGNKMIFAFHLASPTYAQRCFNKLSAYLGEGNYKITEICNSFMETITDNWGIKGYTTAEMNAKCYEMMKESYREHLFDVAMTEAEKNEIKEILKETSEQ